MRLATRLRWPRAKTRYDPSEVEPRIVERWLESGLFHPEPEGDGGRELLDRDPAAERHRRAAHGSRAQQLDPGRLIRHAPRARPADEVDPRHRPRRDRHPDAGRASCSRPREPAVRSSAASNSCERVWQLARAVRRRRSSSSSSASAPRCDYDDERFTLDAGYAEAVLQVFVALYEKGYIYRDRYMVNWDPGLRSAISDLEVEEREVTDTLYYIDYPLASGSGAITVATVRPETMLADTAIAVHPEDERYQRLIGETRDPAARRAAAEDHRRRVRQARLRHRGAEDHSGPRSERLRDRPPPRPRADQRDRRGRPDHRCGPGAIRRA